MALARVAAVHHHSSTDGECAKRLAVAGAMQNGRNFGAFHPIAAEPITGNRGQLGGGEQELWRGPSLRGVNFQVRAGEVVALLGPNGAGKTTAVKLLLGLLQPNGGKVRVFGGDPVNPEN